MSNQQLTDLGLDPDAIGIDRHYQPPHTFDRWSKDEADPFWSISTIESRFYQGNMLLPDADVYSMAHGLELRVPLLDQRLLDLVHAIPGPVRMPVGKPNKYLLRQAAAQFFRPDILKQPKRGFELPIWEWMLGVLRPRCEVSIEKLKCHGVLRPEGVDMIWKQFLREPRTPIWTRALALCVLGNILDRSFTPPAT